MATGGCIDAATKKTGKTAFQRVLLHKRSRRTGSGSGNNGGGGSGGGGSGGCGVGVDVAVSCISCLVYPGNCLRRQKLILPLQLFLMTIVTSVAAPLPIAMTPTIPTARDTTTTALMNESSVHAYAALTIIGPAATTTTTTRTATTTSIFGIGTGGGASLAAATAAAALGSLHLRKRHRKRNSNWYDYYNFNENTTALEWANPCGGFYVPTPGYQQRRRKNQKQIYNLLKRAAGNEFRTLNSSQEDINITNIKIWFLHDYNYKFLPKLKINSTIALKRWYRNMQTYVASFAFLRRVQLKWDRRHPKHESRTARELKHLLLSSRSMLCELETAVNNTYPVRNSNNSNNGNKHVNGGGNGIGNGNGGSGESKHRRQLQQITRAQMNKRLKLRTKRRSTASDDVHSDAADLHEADSIDLRFVKYYYYEFLNTMWKLLRRNTKRQGQQQREQRQQHQQQQQRQRQRQKQRQKQKQKQQQQQKRHRQRQRQTANHKEFNEVEKPTMTIDGNNGINVNIDGIGVDVVRGGGVDDSNSRRSIACSNKKRKHGKRSSRQTILTGMRITTTITTTTSSST